MDEAFESNAFGWKTKFNLYQILLRLVMVYVGMSFEIETFHSKTKV